MTTQAAPTVQLELGDETIALRWTDAQGREQARSLPIGLKKLARDCRFGRPTSALALEAAIEQIEDAVMPLARDIPGGARLALREGQHSPDLNRALVALDSPSRSANADPGVSTRPFGLDTVETLFSELSALALGRPSTQAQVPDTPEFAAAVLILREAMHHLRLADGIVVAVANG